MLEDGSVNKKASPDSDIHIPVNLGNPEEFTVSDLAHKVIRLTGSRSPIEYRELPIDDPRVRQPDITRAKRLLGWEPVVSLEDGLANTIRYFQSILNQPSSQVLARYDVLSVRRSRERSGRGAIFWRGEHLQ